ncbi:MAG: HAMP domain-containing protein [Anaerolineales bacterium]|nr:MAG: HAMP domain-containing protein [Anaerolineales bacterium]
MVTRAPTWLANLGLQRRIQLLTMVGLLAVFAFFWVAGHQAIKASTQQSLKYQLAIAELVASSLDRRLDEALTILETTAAHPDLDRPPPPHSSRLAIPLQDAQLRLSAYGRRLFWLDTNGTILWTEPLDASLISKPFYDLPVLQRALQGNAAYISNLRHVPDSTPAYVLVVVPVRQPRPEISSLLVEEIGIDQLGLEGVLDQLAPSGSSYIEVVDREGVVLASNLPELRFREGDHTDQFTSLIDEQQSLVGECHSCHQSEAEEEIRRTGEVLAFAPLTVAPWGVAIRQPVSEAMAPVNHLRQLILLGGGTALAVGLLITWLVTRQIVGPLQALNEASAQFAAGNLGVPIPRDGIDEVARLNANLEHMRVRLEAILADHRRWNEALEEMVEERTRELSTLYEQLQGREAMCKRLLGKVLTTQEEERTRLARELHDAIGQSLTAIIMTTTAVENSLPAGFTSGKDKLVRVRNTATQALHDLRDLIFDLRPEVLDDLGLGLAVHSQVKKYLEPAGVKVQLRAMGLKDGLPAEVETAVFRVVQEAITNIARHAHASEASISLNKKNNVLIVRVEDNGVGFDFDQVMHRHQQAWGLRGMEERITLLGGKFYVGSRPGSGTLVLAEIPLNQS